MCATTGWSQADAVTYLSFSWTCLSANSRQLSVNACDNSCIRPLCCFVICRSTQVKTTHPRLVRCQVTISPSALCILWGNPHALSSGMCSPSLVYTCSASHQACDSHSNSIRPLSSSLGRDVHPYRFVSSVVQSIVSLCSNQCPLSRTIVSRKDSQLCHLVVPHSQLSLGARVQLATGCYAS